MKTEKLFNHCYECNEIQEGDLIPVGGGMIGSANMPWKVKADFEGFYPKFGVIAEKHLVVCKTEPWQNWLKQAAPDVDPELSTLLQTFTSAFEGKRKMQKFKKYERSDLYEKAPDHTPKLSEIFEGNHAMCVEMALLAKRFLDSKGIKSSLFCGEACFDYAAGDINVPEAHTFLRINHGGEEYVFDPANPTPLNENSTTFTLLKPCVTFDSQRESLRQDCLLIACENILTHKKEYYGVGDNGNVPEKFIIHQPQPTIGGLG